MYVLKNHFRILCSLSLLALVTMPASAVSKRRKALREKNMVVAALDKPDTLAQMLSMEPTVIDDLSMSEPVAEIDVEELPSMVQEDETSTTPSETEGIHEPQASALANLPETIITEETPLHKDDETIELYFENADLQNFVKQIEDLFDISFIMDDALEPLPQNAKSLKGNKITYRTEKPITRARAWSVFNTFLNIAGFAIIPHANERTYRIVPLTQAQRGPVPTYIGVPSATLPETDELIRYVYFLENNTVEGIRNVVEQFRSTASTAVYLNEHRGFILTDISYNIKKLMEIVHELDKVNMPESLSVLKLRQADAKQIKDLYESLTGGEKQQFGPRPPAGQQKKSPAGLALPENVTLIAEPRTNSLILLGPKAAREQIEEFVKTIDVSIDQAYSPVQTYQLKFANAETIAEIMNNVTKFGADTEAGKSGGVRGGDQYLRPMSFIAEPATNTLIIKGHYEDYLKAEKIIQRLDEDQPQVAIEVLILSVTASKKKELGSQMRSKVDGSVGLDGGISGLVGNNVKFQTSGMFLGKSTPTGIVQNTSANSFGVKRLLGNLLDLVNGAGVANTIITMGQDAYGVWGIFQLLESVSNVQLVSNPFLIATNKTPAKVELGETRRVQTSLIAGATPSADIKGLGDESANLQVQITPQINSDGMIVLTLEIDVDNFTNAANFQDATKNTRKIKTSAIMANKQVLAIGGLIRETLIESVNKVPVLGDIPLIGWLFKSKQKNKTNENLLILLSTRIIEPNNTKDLDRYNQKHFDRYQENLSFAKGAISPRDPIHKMFFESDTALEKVGDDFIFKRSEKRKTGRGKMKEKLIQTQKEAEQTASTRIAQLQAMRPLQKVAFAPGAYPELNQQQAPIKPPAPTASSFANPPTLSHLRSESSGGQAELRRTGASTDKKANTTVASAAPPAQKPVPTQPVASAPPKKQLTTVNANLQKKRRSDLSLSSVLASADTAVSRGAA
jgi:general secretion pathway protein D